MTREAKNIYDDKINAEFGNITNLIANNEEERTRNKPDTGVRVDMLDISVFGEGEYLKNALAGRLNELKLEAEEEAKAKFA